MRKLQPINTEKLKASIPNPEFEGLTIGWILKDVFKNLEKIRLFERAAAISFNLMLAIPPSLIFLASLVPFFPIDNIDNGIFNAIKEYIPSSQISNKINRVIEDFLSTKRRDLLSFGLLFAIIYSSNGLMGIMRAFDRDSDMRKFRTAFNRRLKAIWLTMILMVLFLIVIAVLIVQTNVLNYVVDQFPTMDTLMRWVTNLSLGVIILLMLCIIYRFCPSLHTRVRFFNIGAFISTLLIWGISALFVYLSTNFIQYDQVYGSLGTMLMSLVWINILAILILLGFEINMTIMLKGDKSKERKEAQEHKDSYKLSRSTN
jgi:membrane protein